MHPYVRWISAIVVLCVALTCDVYYFSPRVPMDTALEGVYIYPHNDLIGSLIGAFICAILVKFPMTSVCVGIGAFMLVPTYTNLEDLLHRITTKRLRKMYTKYGLLGDPRLLNRSDLIERLACTKMPEDEVKSYWEARRAKLRRRRDARKQNGHM